MDYKIGGSWVDGWMYGQTDRWIDRWDWCMDDWMYELMNMNE